ncbi:hypothetical protein MB901379_02064 [Mycobacterium basiliense]|uniref:Uncharacterized protein n=1 Tax=Mycobacterium basiliense TaxID=2094119 RepID=A0A3S5CZQ6_9MYCO|nr:hypothetical protein MB901379_02064 [Mycobacterium basiliense]
MDGSGGAAHTHVAGLGCSCCAHKADGDFRFPLIWCPAALEVTFVHVKGQTRRATVTADLCASARSHRALGGRGFVVR